MARRASKSVAAEQDLPPSYEASVAAGAGKKGPGAPVTVVQVMMMIFLPCDT